MRPDPEARGQRWWARRLLSTSELGLWTAEQWRDWFVDGLDVWFSASPVADRMLAFAPLRVGPDRQGLHEALATYLRRFYDFKGGEAASVLDLVERIEEGGATCLRSRALVQTYARAHVLLSVFHILRARSLPRLARISMQALANEPYDDPAMDDYLSLVTYIAFDNVCIEDTDSVRNILEIRLRHCRNFRPALFFALQLTDTDVILSLDRFYELTRHISPFGGDIWREVSEEFDHRFGPATVAAAISRVEVSPVFEALDMRGIVPAAFLRPFYPELSPGGLFQADRYEQSANAKAFSQRQIDR